jgi:hypothetical protein
MWMAVHGRLLPPGMNAQPQFRVIAANTLMPAPRIAHATATVTAAFPGTTVRTTTGRFETLAAQINKPYDIALSSLAYQHMPYEEKQRHLRELKPWIDHFIIMAFDANHDTPELQSPDLAVSLYQSYGRAMDFIFAHDVLGPEFTCWHDAMCYADQYFDMFALHYGRDAQ